MKKLLSYKHWQLFLLIFICGAWTSPSPLKEIINGIAVVTFTLWIYAIGIYGHKRIVALGLKHMNLRLFKINTIIVGCFLVVGLTWSATGGEEGYRSETIGAGDVLASLVGVYLVFAMVQTVVFACKILAKLDHRRDVSFGDYFNNLLLLFFFFIGIWWLQPKVNRLIGEGGETD
jgi:hypothetical protein